MRGPARTSGKRSSPVPPSDLQIPADRNAFGVDMVANVLELIESIITDTQSLQDELGQDAQARQHVEKLLNAAHFIRDEMTLYRLGDLINHVPRSASNYAATPFS